MGWVGYSCQLRFGKVCCFSFTVDLLLDFLHHLLLGLVNKFLLRLLDDLLVSLLDRVFGNSGHILRLTNALRYEQLLPGAYM